MDFLKKARIKKWIFIVLVLVILIIALGFIAKSFLWSKVSCVFQDYKSAGSEVYKSYPDQYLTLEEWKKYQDPEVVFFFTPEIQELFSSKISSLKGYGGLFYDNFDRSVSINKGYYGTDCQPTAYRYEMILRGTILGQNLSSSPFGRWYYKDRYKMSAIYQSNSKKWSEFNIIFIDRKLIPGNALNMALGIAKKSSQFQEIINDNYQIFDLYWSPKNQYTESDNGTITFVYSKITDKEKNLVSYITIEVDNFANRIVSEKKEEKTETKLQ
jgi:hypothetical protein